MLFALPTNIPCVLFSLPTFFLSFFGLFQSRTSFYSRGDGLLDGFPLSLRRLCFLTEPSERRHPRPSRAEDGTRVLLTQNLWQSYGCVITAVVRRWKPLHAPSATTRVVWRPSLTRGGASLGAWWGSREAGGLRGDKRELLWKRFDRRPRAKQNKHESQGGDGRLLRLSEA